ncbi:MAG: tRNA preQ1(34) S-adenosylmethionine ribosyltransferase-isomerase QueA [Bacilli bacterium]
MKLEDFDFILPEELIAQTPLKDRDHSRLLVLDKVAGVVEHKKFTDIVSFLNKGDTLVLNDTKVIPARLIGEKEDTKAVIEILLLKEIEADIWETLVKPARRVKIGTIVSFGDGCLKAECVEEFDSGIKRFRLLYTGILYEILDKLGTMPLPPYIHESLEDQSRYQTVYAKHLGSAAAPTAGLHFTEELLKEIEAKGVNIAYITLHVGLGTFRPVNVDNIEEHHMHSEYYSMSASVSELLTETKKAHHDIIAVGTTSVRTLETIFTKYGEFKESSGETDIFIYPGYKYKAVDHIITNFHLPKSTLIMLISAFAGKDMIMSAYQEAIKEKYRFFSFGDSMFIK